MREITEEENNDPNFQKLLKKWLDDPNALEKVTLTYKNGETIDLSAKEHITELQSTLLEAQLRQNNREILKRELIYE